MNEMIVTTLFAALAACVVICAARLADDLITSWIAQWRRRIREIETNQAIESTEAKSAQRVTELEQQLKDLERHSRDMRGNIYTKLDTLEAQLMRDTAASDKLAAELKKTNLTYIDARKLRAELESRINATNDRLASLETRAFCGQGRVVGPGGVIWNDAVMRTNAPSPFSAPFAEPADSVRRGWTYAIKGGQQVPQDPKDVSADE